MVIWWQPATNMHVRQSNTLWQTTYNDPSQTFRALTYIAKVTSAVTSTAWSFSKSSTFKIVECIQVVVYSIHPITIYHCGQSSYRIERSKARNLEEEHGYCQMKSNGKATTIAKRQIKGAIFVMRTSTEVPPWDNALLRSLLARLTDLYHAYHYAQLHYRHF